MSALALLVWEVDIVLLPYREQYIHDFYDRHRRTYWSQWPGHQTRLGDLGNRHYFLVFEMWYMLRQSQGAPSIWTMGQLNAEPRGDVLESIMAVRLHGWDPRNAVE